MAIEELCLYCGHEEEDHKEHSFFRPCRIEDCACDDYEAMA